MKITQMIVFSLIFVSCSATYKTQNISQPIVLSDRIGAPTVNLPPNSKEKGTIDGEVLLSKFIGYKSHRTEEKANADVDFMGCLQTNSNRCVTNLTFNIKNHQYLLFSGGACAVGYSGNCYEIQQPKP